MIGIKMSQGAKPGHGGILPAGKNTPFIAKVRVSNYHGETVKSVAELIAAAGLFTSQDLRRWHINRRISMTKVARFDDIHPYPETGCLLRDNPPPSMKRFFEEATADPFAASCQLGMP
jgi:glutamate synthase domain-containing protein 2